MCEVAIGDPLVSKCSVIGSDSMAKGGGALWRRWVPSPGNPSGPSRRSVTARLRASMLEFALSAPSEWTVRCGGMTFAFGA